MKIPLGSRKVGAWLVLVVLCRASVAYGASQDDDFMAARAAFRAGDALKLERYAKTLKGYVLEPYVDYWRLRLRLDNAATEEVHAVLAQTQDGPTSNSLRSDWLKRLGAKQQWDLFDAEYPQSVGEDTELLCYSLQSRMRAGLAQVQDGARPLWLSGRELPESCHTVFNALFANRQLATDSVWARIRLALETGNTGVARRAAEYLPTPEQPDAQTLAGISVNPQAFLDRANFNLKSRAGRETVMFSVHRLARTAPSLAAQQWTKLGERFSASERGYVWGVIAYLAAQRHDSNALAWYARAGDLGDQQLAWKVRTALRALSWPDVLAAIEAMSGKQAQDPAWRYWKARALKALNRGAEAQPLLVSLAGDFTFYGQLAAEELGDRVRVPPTVYKPAAEDVSAMAKTPGLQRSLAFYRLNLRFEGNREWSWTIRNFDDRQLLAAAEFARRSDLYDRAISSADRTRDVHDFAMRYPAPYRTVMKSYVNQQRLDEAWVYGLIRQESRFIADIKSSAGASGLMQLMPATARWVAGKIGLKNFSWSQTNHVETNINLGTWYMKHVLETLDNHPVLASAAYNAGPGRARGWRADTPMEAAIYSESIPFNETRDYVKKVMSNASYYGQQFGQALLSLKERIGVIAPRSRATEQTLDEPGSGQLP